MSEPLKIIGRLKRYSPIQQVTDTFKKREFVIETDEQYPQTIGFELVQTRVDLIEPYAEGELIEVFFNLKGREWQKDSSSSVRVFNQLVAWRISRIGQPTQERPKPQNPPPNNQSQSQSNFDDLPF